MTKREESIRIGKLRKTWGHKGEIMADLLAHGSADLLPEGFLFVEFDGQQVPFKYNSIRETNKQGVLITFDDYTDPEKASLLQGRALFAPESTIVNEKHSALVDEDLVGVKVVDTNYGELGHIIRTEGTTTQTVLVILKGVKEIMVPLAEDLVEGFDPETATLTMSTPPGLVDMYLD